MIDHALCNVPYRQNPFFTGREDILYELRQELQVESTVALCHPLGISGLGGIGKTQTALEYIYRYHENYTAIFWIRANSTTSLTESFVAWADQLSLPERNEQDQRIIVEAVLCWLRLHTEWLLVFDSMDDLRVAEPFLPKAGQGHILFTTRAHSLGGIAQRLELKKMERETGALLLLRRAGILPLQAILDMSSRDDRSVASEISQELDGLPLALDQAGAYIDQHMKETSCETLSSLQDYLKRYQTRRQELLNARGSVDENRDYSASVATTWSLSFEKVAQANRASAELLDLCAFLSPDAIPEEMITEGASYLSPLLQSVAADPVQFDRSIASLLAYSLIARNADDNVLSIHRLVQTVLQDALPAEAGRLWMQRAVTIVNAAFPDDVGFARWITCERYVLHALLCATWIEQEQMAFSEAAHLLNLAGVYLAERARYTEAEPLHLRSLQIREQIVGKMDLDVAQSQHSLANLYVKQGRFTEAESYYQRALQIKETLLEPPHPSIALSLHCQANLFAEQGRYIEAKNLYRRILQHYRQNSSFLLSYDAVDTMSDLATLYQEQGEYAEAETLYNQMLQILALVAEPQHLRIALTSNNLAVLYKVQGRYTEAEQLYLRALQIREQILGAEHPDVAQSLNNLANLRVKLSKYAEAEPLYLQALQIREQILGEAHPDVAQSLRNLAALYHLQGKYAEAEPLYLRALQICERGLEPLHPSIASCLKALASLYVIQGKYTEAEPLYQRAIQIDEQVLGEMHPDVAQSLNNLANIYVGQSKHTEAELLYQRALQIRESVLGETHPDVAQSLNNLATLYAEQNKYAEAEPLYLRALQIREQILGAEHPDVASCLNNLATLYAVQNKYAEAEPLYLRVLQICEPTLGAEHPDVAQSLYNLAKLYQQQGKYIEAEPLYRRSLQIYEHAQGSLQNEVAQSLHGLASLCHQQGKYVEAGPLYQRALQIRVQHLDPNHPHTLALARNYATLLWQLRQREEA